jgi:hypothetical protein
MAKKKTTATPVESILHKDKRKNIPTEELREFVADEEQRPKTVHYARDPSLDPQLVWKGKDEQDQADLAVPAVPIYIQEKIHPQAIVDNFRLAAASTRRLPPTSAAWRRRLSGPRATSAKASSTSGCRTSRSNRSPTTPTSRRA